LRQAPISKRQAPFSALLEVEPKSAALYIQRIACLADGRCVEFTRSNYPN
jgi:DNA-binding GntR family transcriptional regulator